MNAQSFSNTPAYLLILIGLVLSLVTALVPHFGAGFTLMVSVFAAGILPYLVYGIAAVLMRGMLTTLIGLIIVAIHAWLVVTERIMGRVDYSDGMVYFIPVTVAMATLPLAFIAFRKSTIHS